MNGDHNKSLKDFKKSGCEILSYETLKSEVQHYKIRNWNIITFCVAHNVPCWGIILKHNISGEKLCYVTDFYAMPKVEGINIWLYEVNYVEELVDQMIVEDKLDNNGFVNHNSLENAVEYFSSLKTRPQKIICCHLSASNSIKNKIKKELSKFADEVYIAEKGEIYGE